MQQEATKQSKGGQEVWKKAEALGVAGERKAALQGSRSLFYRWYAEVGRSLFQEWKRERDVK